MKRRLVSFYRSLKEPIAKKDLYNFIKEGLLVSLLFAAMLGALKFLVLFTSFAFLNMFVFLIYYLFLIKRLRGSFHFSHTIYSVLAVIFLILGDYVIGVSGSAIELMYFDIGIKSYIFNPVYQFSFLFYWTGDIFIIILNLLNILIYGVIIYYTYQRMK